MTTMDSDSTSQDSDDGRRFRFEATRKDSVISIGISSNTTKSSRKKFEHKSQCENSKYYRNEKEQAKNESNKKIEHKDFRYSVRHSRHETRSSKQEDNKISHENHLNAGDTFIGSVSNIKDSKNFSSDTAWEKLQDSKWQMNTDRSVYPQRSREYSYDRNHHNDKHRNRYHERYKRRSRDKSRNRPHQSNRLNSSNNDNWSRDNHGSKKHDSLRKISIKENRSQNLRDHFSPKSFERMRNHNDTHSSNLKRNPSIQRDIQDYKKLNLSQFLSETDENIFDKRNSRSGTLSPCLHKVKLKKYNPKNQFENSTKRVTDDDNKINMAEQREELSEVKREIERKNDIRSGFSNNNSSTISDCSFSTMSSVMFPITKKIHKNSEKEKSEYYEQEKMIAYNNSKDLSLEKRCLNLSYETQLLRDADDKQNRLTYGPLLPPGFVSDISNNDKSEKISAIQRENKINENNNRAHFIEPHLSLQSNVEKEINVVKNIAAKANIAFGPALPPHLLQQQCRNDSQDEITRPIMPIIVKLCEKNSGASSEFDDDYAIGPLPIDHPALRSNHVYEQLNLRAQKIRNEKSLPTVKYIMLRINNFINRKSKYIFVLQIDIKSQREEWMTDLPPLQAANLGLTPRIFKLRDDPDISDRSCWTDISVQKTQKQKNLVKIIILLSISLK